MSLNTLGAMSASIERQADDTHTTNITHAIALLVVSVLLVVCVLLRCVSVLLVGVVLLLALGDVDVNVSRCAMLLGQGLTASEKGARGCVMLLGRIDIGF